MTDEVALLLNLVTLAESGQANFKLQVSRTYHDPDDFSPWKDVFIDGAKAFSVDLDEVIQAASHFDCLKRVALEKYMMPPKGNVVKLDYGTPGIELSPSYGGPPPRKY